MKRNRMKSEARERARPFCSVEALSALVQDLKPADCPDAATAPLRDAVVSAWPASLALNPLCKRREQ